MQISKSLWTKILTVGLGATMALGIGLTVSQVVAADPAMADASNWSQISAIGDIVDNAKYAIVNGGYYLVPGAYASSNPARGSFSTATALESYAWTFKSTGTSNQWRITDGTNWIKIETNTTSGLRTQTSQPSTYFTASGSGTSIKLATSYTGGRAIARYSGGTDWRSYATSDSQTNLTLYKYIDSVKTLSSIAVTGTPSKTVYYAGESFDSTGITVTATYSDSSTANVTSSCTYTPDPLTQGTTSVTVSYSEGGVTKTSSVSGLTVNAALTLSSIAVSGTPSKTVYYAGESFDSTGITVTATYNDSSTANVTSSCTYTPDPLTQGTTSVTVSYTENSVTKTSSVSGLTVNAALSSTTVSFGTNAEDNSWTESGQNVGSDYVGIATLSHYVQASATTVFGVNNTLDTSFIVEFKVGTYGGTPSTMPTITVALLDASNGILSSSTGQPTLTGSTESYAQGPTITVAKPANPSSISTIKIYLSNVGNMTTSIYMRLEQIKMSFATAAAKSLSSIAVTSQPTNKSYYNGDSFNPAGMVVTATYSDSSTANVTSGCTYSPDPLTTGTTSVTVSYTEGETKTTSVSGITVVARVLNSISVKTAASKTTFTLGEYFVSAGLVINANYNSGTVEVTSGFEVSGVNTDVLGAQTATVSYEGKSVTYSVDVTNQGASVGNVASITELLISEYYEGASNDKYVEIYNGTSSSINLTTDTYAIKIDANGAGTWGTTIALTGTINAHSTYILAHSSSNASILALANQTSGSVTHNGDDSIGLFKNGTLIDIFGVFGVDPGSGWTIGELANATVDHAITRNNTVTAPVTTWNTAEWTVNDLSLDSTGIHSVSSGDVTPTEQATAFANYVMTGIGNNASGNCTAVYNELAAEYGYMDSDAKTVYDTNSGTLFVNARARMAYLSSWVASQSSADIDVETKDTKSQSSLIASAVIGIIGLTTIAGFYFVGKKRTASN